MSRTPLFRALRRACRMAQLANHRGVSTPELIGQRQQWRPTRRDLLKAGAIATLATGTGTLSGCFAKKSNIATIDSALSGAPRIAIVGAGLAGLAAAHTLKKNGIIAQVFDASTRTGGRIYSRTGLLSPDLTTEMGGEFIDSNHEDLLALVGEFNLQLLDMQSDDEKIFATMYEVDGLTYSTSEVVEAFRPIASLLELDRGLLPEVISAADPGEAKRIDNLSLSTYLGKLGVTGWLRKLLETAYVTEFGLDATEQSALNLLTMIGTDSSLDDFEIFGESDERYKIKGGNDQIISALAGALGGQISTSQTLESIRSKADGYSLVFRTQNGTAKMVAAEVVILALPFTKLREVEVLIDDMPSIKKRAIAELGYGMNSKVFLGFIDRPWRKQGYSGSVYTSQSYQLAWDNGRGQGSIAGGLTCYSGGKNALAIGKTDLNVLAQKYLSELDLTFNGVQQSYNGRVERFHWPTYPTMKGSYAAYRPGQWTTIRGTEAQTVGNVYFAGEHCSMDFQGFMNGAAETGRIAAQSILARMRR
ncbi:FAD-dependent oxidoreductase [Candidatus Sumerlaeota bacterium]|nr:FAD-dependent oxidoreductase [Candidatus Sumerlaeota bacterium]